MAEHKTKPTHATLHPHGDGTYTIQHHAPGAFEAEKTEHPHIGHALMELASRYSDGDHMHIHGDDDGYTTHSVSEGGKPKGPIEHAGIASVKRTVGDCMEGE